MEPCPTLNVSAHLFPIVLQIHVASNQNVLTGSHITHNEVTTNEYRRWPWPTTNRPRGQSTFGQNDKTLQQRRQKQHHLHWNLHYLHWLNLSLMASWCTLSHFWLKLCQELITWPCLHQTSGGSHSWTGHGSLLSWWQRCASTSSVQKVINADGMMVSASTCLHPHLYCLCMSEPQLLIPIMNMYIYNI